MDKVQLANFIRDALAEDIGDGDHTSLACIPDESTSSAELLVKDVGVIAGIAVSEQIFHTLDPKAEITYFFNDGDDVDYGDVAFRITGNTRALLMTERLVLNVMQRMSGIATLSSRFAFEVEDLDVHILDTRKTTPLLRFLEKEAVRIGGCDNYRMGLYDRIMIKDNHVEACGSIAAAIDRTREYMAGRNMDLEITIEVRNLVEVYEVLERGGIDRIMFDNFELPILSEAIAIIGDRFETEASGGVTLQNVRKIAETGVKYISSGALTHSAGTLDMSLKIVRSESPVSQDS